jgi:G6PDH family F420-dependent oxidoreductase
MTRFGYALSAEEFRPRELVALARRAEEAGFEFAAISDHYHPWVDAQGQSPFVWTVLGGIAQATERIRVGTGVTCPTIRVHPAIMAQAAATTAEMFGDRFFFGVGSGENLNEHILGDHWPPVDVRLEMLEEAIEVIRLLWQGGLRSHRGRHYTVENARIYTLPERPPPIIVSAFGPKAASVAARAGDGLWGTSPKSELIEQFRQQGGEGKPVYGMVKACWAEDEATARRTVLERWPNSGIPGRLARELALPSHFEEAATLVTEESASKTVACGPDPEQHLESINRFVEAGYDHVYVQQIGPEQEGFFRFYEREVLPKLNGS